jgi:hypothetical protein
MPVYCQRCGKPFQDTARVLNHMNQPISSCRTYYEEVLQIAEAVHHHHSGPPEQSQPSRTNQPKEDSFEMDQSADGPPLEPAIVPESRSSTPIATDENPTSPSLGDSPFFAEIYPDASKIFGSGPTFMDNFDNDQFFKERQTHLYYPFASKDEWQMASFLLRSGLSMAAIDQFFKLELVSDDDLIYWK